MMVSGRAYFKMIGLIIFFNGKSEKQILILFPLVAVVIT